MPVAARRPHLEAGMRMTWVRRRPAAPVHECTLPMREEKIGIPPLMGSGPNLEWTATRPDGRRGDLWRCPDCQRLWRIGDGCHLDNAHGPHAGPCTPGWIREDAWRPPTLWQRLRYWRKGRP